jgi:hypothetical protein
MQQGRVALDADHNEQTAIDVHYQRTVARDVIGPYAAPAGTTGGFVLATDASGVFAISKGVYYVDGILVENDTDNCTYKTQPDFPVPADDALLAALAGNANAGASLSFWVYLDVRMIRFAKRPWAVPILARARKWCGRSRRCR